MVSAFIKVDPKTKAKAISFIAQTPYDNSVLRLLTGVLNQYSELNMRTRTVEENKYQLTLDLPVANEKA